MFQTDWELVCFVIWQCFIQSPGLWGIDPHSGSWGGVRNWLGWKGIDTVQCQTFLSVLGFVGGFLWMANGAGRQSWIIPYQACIQHWLFSILISWCRSFISWTFVRFAVFFIWSLVALSNMQTDFSCINKLLPMCFWFCGILKKSRRNLFCFDLYRSSCKFQR